MKKSGSAVFLMELTLVILFFSLSTVVTLRLFVAAHQQERQSTLHSDALELAENTAELFLRPGRVLFCCRPTAGTAAEQEDGSVLYSRLESGLRMEVIWKGERTPARPGWNPERSACLKIQRSDPLCRLPLCRYSPGEAVL